MKQIRYKLLLFVLIAFTYKKAASQNKSVYEILKIVSRELQPKYPFLDTLLPGTYTSFWSAEYDSLSKKELTEIEYANQNRQGLRLFSDSSNEIKIITGKELLKSFINPNLTDIKDYNERQIFYIAANPIFFNNNKKSIFKVSTNTFYSRSILLEFENGKWIIKKIVWKGGH